jgi:dinuclear metal center YbgI/SA1388 family protein
VSELSAQDLGIFLNELLSVPDTPDYPGALNGLQLDREGPVRRIAAAVDFSRATVEGAIRVGADLLIVHHGMFWGGQRRIVGPRYDQLRLTISRNIGVYSAHLPLDLHRKFGNNALLARDLGLTPTAGFARFESLDIGLSGSVDTSTKALLERVEMFARPLGGQVRATAFSSDRRTHHWAMCTGAGASSDTIREAVALGVDTLIVGEGPHHTAVEARDNDLVVIYAGHYATETLGVKAIAAHLSSSFGLPWDFVHAPTGL